VTVLSSPFSFVADAGAAGAKNQPATTLSLLAPPGFVTPDQPFSAELGVKSTLDRGSLNLEVTVYEKLPNRSEFDETLGGTPLGTVVGDSGPIPLTSLPADPKGVDLTVPVIAGGSTTPGSGPFTADLDCQLGSCGGVYPLLVQLTGTASSTVLAHVLTYLVYTDPSADSQPLRFALVVPIDASTTKTAGTGALPRPTSAALSELDSLLFAVSGTRAALTLAPSPTTLSELAAERSPRSVQALHSLTALAGSADRQVLCGPFADADATQLVSTSLTGELTAQVQEGAKTLQATLGTSCGSGGTWVSRGALDQSALSALANLGYRDVVVPQGAMPGPIPSATWSRLFYLGDTRSDSLEAKTVDPGVSAHLQPAARTDPVLAADQVLAELELIYYEYPGAPDPRGVVAVAPSGWGANPTFVADLLVDLQENPMVRPVTLSGLFAQVAVGGKTGNVTQPSSKRPAGDGTTAGLPARAIRLARARLEEFAGAVSRSAPGATEVQLLDELLLAAESGSLNAKQQQAAVSDASNALFGQLHSLSVNAGEIRLTSNAALVPITVVKNLPYPVTGVIGVTSDKLAFPQNSQAQGSLCLAPQVRSSPGRSSFKSLCVISHSTNVVYVDMRARTSGDFRISVTLTSPTGTLVLANGQLTVRSMSTSAVAIALSALAVLVLLVWWGRTFWRGARGKQPAYGRRARNRT
jgi:hypothetical protein